MIPDPYSAYVEPEEIAGPIIHDKLPFDVQIIQESEECDVKCTELRFLSEIHDGQRIYMHAWLCRPLQADRLPPLLIIPGGVGISQQDLAVWAAQTCHVTALAVDWIGSGKSSKIPGLDPWDNAMRFEGEDYRESYQYHNLRALIRATNFLLSQPNMDPDKLMAIGGSWGGFYTWLLAGLDDRFSYIFPTFGCGFLDTECRNVWESYFASMGKQKSEAWLRAFDPGRRAHLIKASVFYQQATNDKFYSLLASMKMYHRVRSQKRLLLVRNQDHFTKPYAAQDFRMVRYVLGRDNSIAPPVLRSTRWIPGTNHVEIDAQNPDELDLSIVYSWGDYTKSFGRYWKSARTNCLNGRWIAEIPVLDVHREIWFYAHAEHRENSMAASTPVQRLIPYEMGLQTPTAEYNPSFDFAKATLWNLPVGDRQHPEMRLVEEGGVMGLAMRFTGIPGQPGGGFAYCLEGDLIVRHRMNAIRLMVKIPKAQDVQGLKLVLATDFHALAEQTYGVDLVTLGQDFSKYQTLELAFSEFTVFQHRPYVYWTPELLPLDVSRLCAVGFYHPEPLYAGEAIMAKICVIRKKNAADPEPPSPVQPAWPPRHAILNEPDPLAVTGQGVINREHSSLTPAAPSAIDGDTSSPHKCRDSHMTSAGPDGLESPIMQERPKNLHPYDFYIRTSLSPETLREKLKQWEPWRQEIIFSNGVRTSEFQMMVHFTRRPLAKWDVFEKAIPKASLQGRKALDIGCNSGYHCLNLRSRYDMDVLGIDFLPRHIEVARFLSEISGLDRVRFLEADANDFRMDGVFDLVIHLGTLDHLKNPMHALDNVASMLAPDGYLALELQTYKNGDDETVCKFIGKDYRGDSSCWWFPGKTALIEMLEACAFDRIQVLHEWADPELIGADMRRLRLLARKPSRADRSPRLT